MLPNSRKRKSYLLITIFSLLISCTSSVEQQENSTDLYRAGVYSGSGASSVCITETIESMKIDNGFVVCTVSPIDIQNGKLDSIDVLIFPGGSGSTEYLSLGQSGADRVKQFAGKKGKGIVGICAGGYLLATTEGYPSLKMLNTSNYREHYNRGRGLIAFELNEKGEEIFPELADLDSLFIQFYDGPIYKMDHTDSPTVIGTIISDIATKDEDPRDLTPGKPSFIISEYGEGKIIVSVGHPEATAGMRWMVPRMARYVIDAPLISYDSTVIRPYLNQKEILFFSDQINREKSWHWDLYNENDSIVIASLENLHSIRSRPSIRWSMGLLRHHSAIVRIAAAEYLLETGYTYAIPELITAAKIEKDSAALSTIENSISRLSVMVHK